MSVSEHFRTSNRTAFHRQPAVVGIDSGRTSAEAYCDQARKLRLQFGRQPEVLQQSLRQLSRRYDQAQAGGADILVCRDAEWAHSRPEPRPAIPPTSKPRIYAVPTEQTPDSPFARAVVDWFADQVARQFSGQLLHHSQRRSLLKTADRLGIDRFHANLIIAVAQHEATKRPNSTTRLYPTKRRFSFAGVAVVAVVQGLIVWGAWRVLRGI